jgi:hypothetical protein
VNPDVAAIFDEGNVTPQGDLRAPVWFGTVWGWDVIANNGRGQYVSTPRANGLSGHWIYASAACTVVVTGNSHTIVETPFVPGWNFLGVSQEKLLENVPGLTLPGYAWSMETQMYHPLAEGDTLFPGEAYFFFATEAGEL